FFEGQQENQRVILSGTGNSNNDSDANGDFSEANQHTVTNLHHLAVAPIKAMNGGVGSPTKSITATEEHCGTQLSSHIEVTNIVDPGPKVSELALYCGRFALLSILLDSTCWLSHHIGLNENNGNPNMMNYALHKQHDK